MSTEKFRSRKFCLLLYPDNEEHVKCLEYIKLNYDYAYILHDKDINEVGELNKPHWHVVLSFSNAKWNSAIAEDMGLSLNYIQNCRNMENALNYLIHYNDEEKYQYSIEEVHGTLKNKLEKLIINDGKDEHSKSFELIEYIENYDGYLSIAAFSRYCAYIGMWDVFRRASVIYLEIIKEHNINYKQNN